MTTTPVSEPVDLFAPDLLSDPYAGYARLREQAPVLTASMMGGPPMWLVTRYADVRTVLTDPRFANDPATAGGPDIRAALMAKLGLPDEMADYLAQNILNSDGADHTRLRKLVSRAFTVRRVSELRPRVEEIAATLLDDLAAAGAGGTPVDLVEAFSYPLPITVICELVGIDEPERAQWHRWGRDLSGMDRDAMPVALREMVAHVQDMIARRRAEPADDLLTALVQAQEDDGDRLTDKEMVTMVIALVIAGHETTAHLVSNAVLALLSRPDQLDRLRADDTLWPQAVHELMRLRGPVQILQTRYAVSDVELGGTTVPAGAPVQAVVVSANTDPREFADPDRLDVEREAGRGEGHLGFGQGAHYCLGAALARQEAEVALRALFTRFPDLRPAVPVEEIRFVERPGFRRVEALPLTGF
ncbi:cytochrome P450 [Pseudonocardia sp. KRD291]|uniref:cytochrome P450 family protein n=1 Tax=Pseudonocardia sp. KRD291 TaxID=2792007 RepID=UPI001C4A0BBE|nr:cytochrome P450 [Pseudonocardia sp. KRD291]MBW0105877.1 cytochrome P450 [Pseudonocardia sp. KRD291]